MPLTGWLAARFGAVRVFATAMGLFGLASLLCGLASNSLGMLVFARILWPGWRPADAAVPVPLLLRIFPPGMAPAIGLWSMTTLIAPVLGPIVAAGSATSTPGTGSF